MGIQVVTALSLLSHVLALEQGIHATFLVSLSDLSQSVIRALLSRSIKFAEDGCQNPWQSCRGFGHQCCQHFVRYVCETGRGVGGGEKAPAE